MIAPRSLLACACAAGIAVAVAAIPSARCASAQAAQGPARAQAPVSVSGSLEEIDAARGTIVIRTAEGSLRTGSLGAQTVITLGGMPGALRDLRPGQTVVAQFAVSERGAPRREIVRLEVRLGPR